jgi:hypothetical protein
MDKLLHSDWYKQIVLQLKSPILAGCCHLFGLTDNGQIVGWGNN